MNGAAKGIPAQKGGPPVSRAEIAEKLKLEEMTPLLKRREEWRNSEEGEFVLRGLLEQLKCDKSEARARAANMIGDFGYWKAIGALLDAYEKEEVYETKIAIVEALGLVASEYLPTYEPWPPEFYSSPDCLRAREKLIEIIRKGDDPEIVTKAAEALGYYYKIWWDADEVLRQLSKELEKEGKDELSRIVHRVASDMTDAIYG